MYTSTSIKETIKVLTIAFTLIFSLGLSVNAFSQANPLIMAIGAPNCTGSSTAWNCSAKSTYFGNFIGNLLPSLSGVVFTFAWSTIDNCTDTMGNPVQCSTFPTCSATETNSEYKVCGIENGLLSYTSQPGFAQKKIAIVIAPVSDASPITMAGVDTPTYVFSQSWANSQGCPLGVPCPPQEVVVCGSWHGDVGSGSCPVYGSFPSGTSEYAIWNANGKGIGSIPNGCTQTGSLSCATAASCGSSGVTDFTGVPVVYETPFINAYQAFIQRLVQHYSPNSTTTYGKMIAPYIAYMRIGLANGGENYPFCAVSSLTSQGNYSSGSPNYWRANTAVPAGFVVNTNTTNSGNGTQYVSIGGGTTSNAPNATQPTCSPAGCVTPLDGTVPGWYNAGIWGLNSGNNAIWPGPNGAFATPPQANQFVDNGYLTRWPSGATGYVSSMINFLKTLNPSFPLTVSSHGGPPLNTNNGNIAYADSTARMASANGIGFGMQAVSVYDRETLAVGAFPSSTQDWVQNFKSLPAPVHHLQTAFPGNTWHAAGYPIVTNPSAHGITVSGSGSSLVITVNCLTDCSPYAGEPIFIAGNSNSAFNGIWDTCLVVTSGGCSSSSGVLQFQPQFGSSITSGMYGDGGVVWAADYLPIVVPFAVLNGASSIEVYECDLDYGYGLYNSSLTNVTTDWVAAGTSGGGCVAPDTTVSPASPVLGPPPNYTQPDQGYEHVIEDALLGMPKATSQLVGKATVVGTATRF